MDYRGLDVPTVQTVAVVILGVLLLIFVAVIFLIRRILAKLFILALIAVVAVAVFSQRENLSHCAKACSCSFFGLDLQINDTALAPACPDAAS